MMKLNLFPIIFVSIFLSIAMAYPTDIPKTIQLDSLSKEYKPVEFSHRSHAEMAGDCASCHHHSGKGSTPACGECHEPITVYRYSIKGETGIGLKGAYHLKCMGCHKDTGSGPVGCTDCHEKAVKK